MLNKIIELIYPNVCGFCNKIISKEYTCKSCKEKLQYIYESEKQQVSVNDNFDVLICAYKYKSIVRNKILEYKFKNKKYLYRSLSERLHKLLLRYENEIDYIIPVPIHIKRYFKRGYNQSELVARFLSQNLKKRMLKSVIVKIKNTRPQSLLTASKRKKNVCGAYKIKNSKLINGKTILLVDDIYTTGATVNECAKVLKENGVKKIIVATIAKATAENHVAKEEMKWMN